MFTGPYMAEEGVLDTSEYYGKEECNLDMGYTLSMIDERNLGACKVLNIE